LRLGLLAGVKHQANEEHKQDHSGFELHERSP
jgi:hypothetical protein